MPTKKTAEAVIVEATRTPIGKKNGSLANIRPDELASHVLREVVRRTKIDPAIVDDVIMGCNTQTAQQAANIGRLSVLGAGFPYTVPACTLNRACGSSQQAVNFGAQSIVTRNADVVIGAGVEHMTLLPIGADFGEDYAAFNPKLIEKYELVPMTMSSDMMAEKYKIPRMELDKFALWSHKKAVAAWDAGKFEREVTPIEAPQADGSNTIVKKDDSPRRDTSLEKLASLPTLHGGTTTAGNACPINDGAAAVLMMSQEKADELGLKARAVIRSQAVVGVEPVTCLEGPIYAIPKCLGRAGLTLSDIDLMEINEAFASVILATGKMLRFDAQSDKRLAVHGGSIALGHPLGASGARLVTTVLHALEDRRLRYGLVSMCVGLGLGTATIIERVK